MAKKAKKGNGKAKVAVKPEQPREPTKAKSGEAKQGPKANHQAPDLDALRKPVLDANAGLTKAEAEAKALVDKALVLVACQRRFSCGQICRFIFGHFCRFASFLWWHGVSPFFASWVQSDRPGGDEGERQQGSV
jgi:hypothetical protein